MHCAICGADHAACVGPHRPIPVDLEVTMVVNVPRIVETVANDPRDMVRVKFSERDVRSYTRLEAEKLLLLTPGATILDDQAPAQEAPKEEARLSGAGTSFEDAAQDLGAKAAGTEPNDDPPARAEGTSFEEAAETFKAQRTAPNKGRRAAPLKGAPEPTTPSPPSEPASPPAEGESGGESGGAGE